MYGYVLWPRWIINEIVYMFQSMYGSSPFPLDEVVLRRSCYLCSIFTVYLMGIPALTLSLSLIHI